MPPATDISKPPIPNYSTTNPQLLPRDSFPTPTPTQVLRDTHRLSVVTSELERTAVSDPDAAPALSSEQANLRTKVS